MKNRNLLGLALIFVLIIILAASLYFAARNMSYFDIQTVNVEIVGQSGTVNQDLSRLINRIKGSNIFEISPAQIKNTILTFDSVESVSVKRYFPSALNIRITYQDYLIRAYAVVNDAKILYLADSTSMHQVESSTYELYSSLAEVELYPAYASMTEKWGYDQGYIQMLELVRHLGSNNLITDIKYDNNNKDGFGLLYVETENPDAVLFVREPVTSDRLLEALSLIKENGGETDSPVRYDLYSTALVKRK